MADDIASIRATLTTLVASNADVLLVLHSAGGFLGSEAMQGLSARERREQGLEGGVMGIVFLAAGLAPTGHQHVDLPFFDKVNGPPGGMCCVTPRALLFNDLSSAEAAKWEKELRTQPADGWNGVTAHCGWKDVESTYLVCGQDSVLPEALQLHFAEMAGSRIVRCNAGHMAMLSMPEKVVEVVRGVVEGEVGTFGN
jgi:pimeloyl-ACP methyl ester carboxylesterase